MNWSLAKSRSLFFHHTQEDETTCFWVSEQARLVALGASAKPLPDTVRQWKPSAVGIRSNCPEIHETIQLLTEVLHPQWHGRIKNLYAGRTSKHGDLAFGKKSVRGGWLAVSIDYSLALITYAGAYDKYLQLLDLPDRGVGVRSAALSGDLRRELDGVADTYRRDGLGALMIGPSFTRTFRSERWVRSAEQIARMSEAFVITHEVAHQVMHGASQADRKVRRQVRGYLNTPAIRTEVAECSLEQREEIEADILAYLTLAGQFVDQETAAQVVTATHGAAFALITIGHLRHEWLTGPEDTHPGCLIRIAVLMKLACQIHGKLVLPPEIGAGRSIPRLAAVLASFADWAARASAHRESDLQSDLDSVPGTETYVEQQTGIQTYLDLATQLGLLADGWEGAHRPLFAAVG